MILKAVKDGINFIISSQNQDGGWEYKPNLRQFLIAIYALIWIVTIISGSLSYLQLGWISRAVQISIPVYLFILVNVYTNLAHGRSQSMPEGSA